MNDPLTALLAHVPEKYRGWVTFVGLCLPWLTRAYHALTSGGGLRGVWSGVLFGTNTPTGSPGQEAPVKITTLKTISLWIGLVSLSLLLYGCKATLEPGGAYAPVGTNGVAAVAADVGFFEVDSAFDLADSAVLAVMKFERDNRAMLWKASAQIKHTLDGIRPQIVAAEVDYAKARQVYMANPTPANLSGLQEILSKAQSLLAAAQAALPTKK